MDIPDNPIYEVLSEVYGLGENKSNPIGSVTMDVTLTRKMISVDFLVMNYKLPYNAILRRD